MKTVFKIFKIWHNGYNDMGDPVDNDNIIHNQRVCIDLNGIDTIVEAGHYRDLPNDGDIEAGFDEPRVRNRNAPMRPRRRRQVFEMDTTYFTINMKNGASWNVMGSFDEFAEIMTHFQSQKETV